MQVFCRYAELSRLMLAPHLRHVAIIFLCVRQCRSRNFSSQESVPSLRGHRSLSVLSESFEADSLRSLLAVNQFSVVLGDSVKL